MSAPLRAILNDRNVSPPRSARFRPEPQSATGSAFGPEPVSATTSERRSVLVPQSSSRSQPAGFHSDESRVPTRIHAAWPQRKSSLNTASAFEAVGSQHDDPMDVDNEHQVLTQARQLPTQLLNPSDSIVAKRRRGNASNDPLSPTKRPRLRHVSNHVPQLRGPAIGFAPHVFPPSRPPPSLPRPSRPPPRPPFPGIFNALLSHPELILHVSSHLAIPSLISLYATSRSYHLLVNQCFTAFARMHADVHAPESNILFPFHCYKRLCRPDPGARINELRPREIRAVPSLRWVQMVEWRERVVDEILALMQLEGLNFPAKTSKTLKKIWFLMDLPDNKRRVGLIRNTEVWTDDDLYRATEFMLKLDMRFTDPRTGSGSHDLRKLVLAQRSLATLWRVLKREELRTQLEVLRMAVKTNYVPPRFANLPVLGVPPKRVGMLQWEGYGKRPGSKLLQVDELLMKESIRRDLPLQAWYLDMALSGFVDKQEGGEWKDVFRQDEVEVVEVEVDSEGEELEDDSEWETEDEYFRGEGSSEEDEEMENEENEEEWDGPRCGGIRGNLLFDNNDDELKELMAQHQAYYKRVGQGSKPTGGSSSRG